LVTSLDVSDDVYRQLVGLFESTSSTLGPEVAELTKEETQTAGPLQHVLLRLTPRNPRSAPIAASIFGEVTFTIGRNGCRVELGDIIESQAAAVETTRKVVAGVVEGRYFEKVQRLPGLGVVAAVGYPDVGGRQIDFGRGFLMPFLKTDVTRYEPYRSPFADPVGLSGPPAD